MKKTSRAFGAFILSASLLVPAAAQAQDAPAALTAGTTLMTGDNQKVGMADFLQTPNGVMITLNIQNMAAGEYALHIHEKGDCSPLSADATQEKATFSNAGGHLNPFGAEHGFLVAGGPHPGDMPNIHVPENGMLKAEIFNPMILLSAGDANDKAIVLDTDGGALMLHAKGDDYHSAMTGNAGSRMACGEITVK